MEASDFDQRAFFSAVEKSGARAIAPFNRAAAPSGLAPNHPEDEARKRGRYVLENDEHVDVLVSRSRTATDGTVLAFEDAWARRQKIQLGDGCGIWIPSLDDLIVTKRFASRPKDAEDVRLLELLRDKQGSR